MRDFLGVACGVAIVIAFGAWLWWLLGPVGMLGALGLMGAGYGVGIVVRDISKRAGDRDRRKAEERARGTW
jgi:hypothetical protein